MQKTACNHHINHVDSLFHYLKCMQFFFNFFLKNKQTQVLRQNDATMRGLVDGRDDRDFLALLIKEFLAPSLLCFLLCFGDLTRSGAVTIFLPFPRSICYSTEL